MTDLSGQQSDARLRATFFRSITLVTSASAIIVAGSEGVLYPAAITPFFAVAGWMLAEHLRWVRIPVLIGNLFGVAAFFVAANEFVGGTLERKLLAGSHLVIYLSWILLILPKGYRQYWWLTALSVLQLAIAGLLSGGVGFGLALLGMMLLLLWTMSVFSLFRVQDQHARKAALVSSVPTPATADRTHQVSQEPANPPDKSLTTADSRAERRRKFIDTFLGLGFLRDKQSARSEKRQAKTPLIQVRNGLQRDPSETWVGWRFRGMVGGSYVISVLLALIVFAAFPRVWVPGTTLLGDVASIESGLRNRTGFSEFVSLGDIGTIMQSDERVLAFDITNISNGKKVSAETFADAMMMDEIRFRGNVFAFYKDGQWRRGFREKGYGRGEDIRRFGEYIRLPRDFRMNIIQDPPPVVFAFAPYPVSDVIATNGSRLEQAEISGSLMWLGPVRSESATRAFSVDCPRLDLHPDATFEFWSSPDDISDAQKERLAERRLEFTRGAYIMDGFEGPGARMQNGQMVMQPRQYSNEKDLKFLLPRLYELAQKVCSENGTLVESAERVNRIVKFLSNENGFSYSLKAARSDRSLDPVEDFVLNTKTGHCEYFASACTLMLQSVNVPARLVNGYYGCEENSLTAKYEVRQKHAHAWVEAFVDDRWRTVEPTPSADRRDELDTVGQASLISNIQTAISDLWNDRIHQMSAERQQEFFAPVISTSKTLFQTIRDKGLLNAARQSVLAFIESPSSVISWQGGVVVFLLLLAISLFWRLQAFSRMLAFCASLARRFFRKERSARSVIRFYEGFCTLCEKNGLRFSPAHSAMEIASLAVDRFGAQLAAAELSTLPSRIATAFNEVRFGELSLTDQQAADIKRDLGKFADTLKLSGKISSTPRVSS